MRRVTTVATPTAHLVGPGKLKVINGHLAFATAEQGPLRLDPRALHNVFCYGPVGVTDEAVQVLFQNGIQLAWLTPAGHLCRGRLVADDPATTSLRIRQQQAFVDPVFQLDQARRVVQAKIESAARAVRHYQRHGRRDVQPALQQLQETAARCAQAADVAQLRGLEGSAGAAWFGVLGQLLLPPWQFPGRVRRPPTDPVNALLSLGYTWLLQRTVARCQAAGLEIYLGALHEYRAGRPSLACDLIEPFRVPAVDRWVIGLCNGNKIQPEHFDTSEEGVRLQKPVFPRMLQEWDNSWINGGHEHAVDQTIQQLLNRLRQYPVRFLDGPSAAGS